MVIFAIIVFGLAGIRTISQLVIDVYDTHETTFGIFMSSLIVVTYWWCYIWFLTQYVTLK